MFTLLKGKRGFALIENILASTILATGLLAGLVTMQNASINTLNGDMNTIATQLASEKLEMILADKQYQGYEYLDGESTYTNETLSGAYNGYTRSVSITEVDATDLVTPSPGSGIKKVDVHVDWGQKDYQNVTVSTLVADYL